MKVAPIPSNEKERLAALARYDVLDTSPEEAFDRITRIAAGIAGTPIALVSLVDSARQWFKSHHGLEATETSRDVAFCSHAILQDEILVVSDSLKDERFFDNPIAIGDPHVRFYAGAPLVTDDGYKLGTLCVIDSEPHEGIDAKTANFLHELACIVVRELELHRVSNELCREIAVRRKAQSDTELKAKELERSNKLLSGFAVMASHDMKEPLRMVTSYTSLLSARYSNQLDSDARVYIGFACDGAQRMQAMVESMLELSQLSAGELDFQSTSSSNALDIALWNLNPRIEATGARVESRDLPMVRANAIQLQLLFQNLIGNAIKYRSDDAPHVEVSAEKVENSWHFKVADNGIGIDAKYQACVFDMFKRLHNRAEIPGTGLGLTICKTVVERHGGKLWVESKPGSGSCFNFTLPSLNESLLG